mmetsp:Transcript_29606/g.61727  ORF Transcript_29606/g.61727 Transcript_29606/m.61727 type:complete len:227 (-) Transcript_29606:334-1014(-)
MVHRPRAIAEPDPPVAPLRAILCVHRHPGSPVAVPRARRPTLRGARFLLRLPEGEVHAEARPAGGRPHGRRFCRPRLRANPGRWLFHPGPGRKGHPGRRPGKVSLCRERGRPRGGRPARLGPLPVDGRGGRPPVHTVESLLFDRQGPRGRRRQLHPCRLLQDRRDDRGRGGGTAQAEGAGSGGGGVNRTATANNGYYYYDDDTAPRTPTRHTPFRSFTTTTKTRGT